MNKTSCLQYLRVMPSLFFLIICIFNITSALANQVYELEDIPDKPLGKFVYYLQESDHSLSFAEAFDAYTHNKFIQGQSPVLSFGIGAPPVWIAFSINNSNDDEKNLNLLLDNSWTDRVQLIIHHRESGLTQQYNAGDNYPFFVRPQAKRTFHFGALFPSGVSDIFFKIETPDPMVIPIYLLSKDKDEQMSLSFEYSYGFIYGYLIALLAYNTMLFFGLRDRRYLLYAIYLGAFTLTNISYTGHGFMWMWPGQVEWQRWGQPILMILYGITGLIFALYFLDIKQHASRIFYSVIGFIAATVTLLIATISFNNQTLALLTAFGYVAVYVVLMFLLGLAGIYYKNPSARYFLLAVIAGLVGAGTTLTATWGFIPFNNWTFRAVEIGMLIEATLLALALAYQVRYVEEKRVSAEKLAHIDPLTELDNRRSFYAKAKSIWSSAERHDRILSVILFDIDNFKTVNDDFGHLCGDLALTETGKTLLSSIRKEDICARWGGEEFILLLPESGLQNAKAFAERLREKIETLSIGCNNKSIRFTASFGVAQKTANEHSLDALIARADKVLYTAKTNGKNKVVVDPEEG